MAAVVAAVDSTAPAPAVEAFVMDTVVAADSTVVAETAAVSIPVVAETAIVGGVEVAKAVPSSVVAAPIPVGIAGTDPLAAVVAED